MNTINSIFNLILSTLEDECFYLQEYNNKDFKNRVPAIGEIVRNLSPVTKLVKGYNKHYYGGQVTHYNYSLQIGSATKCKMVEEIKRIFILIKDSVENIDRNIFKINENDSNIFISDNENTISVNIDFEGTAFNTISIRLS